MNAACPFCTLTEPDGSARVLLDASDSCVAFADGFPSAPGHTLIIPRRHVPRILDLTDAESAELWAMARGQLARLDAERPDGFTIGVNDGAAAGQTVRHTHLHIIPRHHGDTAKPRGGIRWVRPETADYPSQ